MESIHSRRPFAGGIRSDGLRTVNIILTNYYGTAVMFVHTSTIVICRVMMTFGFRADAASRLSSAPVGQERAFPFRRWIAPGLKIEPGLEFG